MSVKRKDNRIILDKEEKELEKLLEKGEFVADPDLRKSKEMFREAAINYRVMQKSKRITIRVNNTDLIKVKAKAQNSKIPYQTLLNILIHQYAQGKMRIEV